MEKPHSSFLTIQVILDQYWIDRDLDHSQKFWFPLKGIISQRTVYLLERLKESTVIRLDLKENRVNLGLTNGYCLISSIKVENLIFYQGMKILSTSILVSGTVSLEK